MTIHLPARDIPVPTEAELHIWEAAGHGLFLNTAPEDADLIAETRAFADRYWPTPR